MQITNKPSNGGKMLTISKYKAAVAANPLDYIHKISPHKLEAIKSQVAKRTADLETLKKWNPKETRRDRRKNGQVGS